MPANRPRRLTCAAILFVATLAASGASAQNFIAYPQDTMNGNASNNGPLGRNPTGSTDEVRAQIAIPAGFLPSAGGTVVAIEVSNGASTGSVPYASLVIRAANLPRTTPFPALDPTFALNLGAMPVTVFSQTAFSITYPHLQWTQIPFATPFQYQGGDHLVLDFEKVIANTATTGVAHTIANDRVPYDLPIMMVSFGALGSGAHLSPVNTSTGTRQPPRVRVVFQNAPTTVVSSPTYWTVGSSFTLTTQATIGSLALQTFELTNTGLSARSTLLWIPGLAGFGWVIPGPLLATLFVGPSTTNATTTTITLPNNNALRGYDLVFQSAVIDPVAGITWTNAADARLR